MNASANVSQSTRPAPEEWLSCIKELEARGELIAAYDESCRGLAEYPNDLWLRHRAVLNLARSGATSYARQMFAELGLTGSEVEDIAALEARLVKDDALVKRGAARASVATQAAGLYEKIYRRTGNYYPGINAATMHLLGGSHQRADALAREVLAKLDALPADPADAFYRSASRAEALLLVGQGEFTATLKETAALARDHAAMASTRRQLRLICDVLGHDSNALDVIAPPSVIHFCGHRMSPPTGVSERFPASREASVRSAVAERLADLRVGFGYGSLASGADIIVAELLLANGAELHVVLPFGVADFKTVSVNDGGAAWSDRFDACLARASSVTFATQGAFLGDATIFRYASSLAMGLAVMRSRWLDADLEQIAVWDGRPSAGPGGTADDVGFWRGLGNRTHAIDPTTASRTEPLVPDSDATSPDLRPPRAIMFGDVRGFSRLDDREIICFLDHVMAAVSRVLDKYGDAVLYRNTWGDGLYLIMEDADVAADCALDLQEAVANVPLAQLGLPETLALRIGGHFGPVWDREDPVLHHRSFFGAHVSRAARIEPVTVPGSVFVSEPFAARLALLKPDFRFEYVGERQTAKGFGAMRMYFLTRRVVADPTV